jgi:hypothetical protein
MSALSARIYHLLRSKVLISYEWGFHAPHSFPHGLGFKVRGAAFTGTVQIFTKEFSDTYRIVFANEFDEEVKRISEVREEDLVDLLRANIDGSESWKVIKEGYYSQLVLNQV